ncbi:MAG TPA: peptidylprolyl isomerase, partial [Terriglobales bacterium]|nr:peptidylprolyl isomerase [Terriglobales bacterium]
LFCGLLACTESKPPAESTAAPAAASIPLPEHATAILDTTAGKMTCQLFPQQAPETVRNFIGLAEGSKDWISPFNHRKVRGMPLYSGVIFHRVIPGFMIQAGDPSGTGSGDVGFTIPDELVPALKFDKPGRLAMANTLQPNTGGSQFFITETPQHNLDACFDLKGCSRGGRFQPKGYGFTIFGQCDAATVALVKKIARMPRDKTNDRPFQPVKINKITIERGDAAPAAKKP